MCQSRPVVIEWHLGQLSSLSSEGKYSSTAFAQKFGVPERVVQKEILLHREYGARIDSLSDGDRWSRLVCGKIPNVDQWCHGHTHAP